MQIKQRISLIICQQINLNNNRIQMHRSINSAEILSKTFSRVNMGENSISSLSRNSPQLNTYSERERPKSTIDALLHETLISKNKKLTMMIRTIHSYMTSIEQLDWIMSQTQKIMKNYLKVTLDKAGTAHKIQIENLYNEITKLISRFSGLDKKWIYQMTVPLKQGKKFNNHLMNINLNNRENVNMMNFKKTETIGSFKCMDTQNEEQTTHLQTDFSKIKLPSVIKQNELEQNAQTNRQANYSSQPDFHTNRISNNLNISNYNNEVRLKQTEAALQIIRKELEKEKRQKLEEKQKYEQKVRDLSKKIQICDSEWEMYKGYANGCIKKIKLHLKQLVNPNSPDLILDIQTPQNEVTNRNDSTKNNLYGQYVGSQYDRHSRGVVGKKIQDFLDQLFLIENKLDRKILQNSTEEIDVEKQQKVRQLINLQIQVKKKKEELDRHQTQRLKFSNDNGSKSQNVKFSGQESNLARLLYIQASTIQHLLL